jgi:hypothetical protein
MSTLTIRSVVASFAARVGEVGQRPGQDPQGHAPVLAPAADGLDVAQVPAEPEQLGDGQGVAGVRGGGDLPERGPLRPFERQRNDGCR